jgi:hypothetical protein
MHVATHVALLQAVVIAKGMVTGRAASSIPPPNIVVIVADDYGFNGVLLRDSSRASRGALHPCLESDRLKEPSPPAAQSPV